MALSFLDTAMPYFNRMHEMTVEHTHEEIQLLAIDFSTMLFETTAPMPPWRDALPGPRPAPQLRLPAQDPPGAAVAAGRDPLGPQVPPTPRAVPRAGRDVPRRHLRRHPPRPGLGDRVDGDDARLHVPASPATGWTSRASAHYWADRLERMLRRCAEEHDVLPADQTIDVHFDEFMADDLAMVARVYDLAGQPLDDTRPGRRWRRSWPRTRGAAFGAVDYDLARVRPGPASSGARPLAFYTERFGVTLES